MGYSKLAVIPLHRLYLWFCAPLLLALTYILPPFQGPDEAAHFYRAIQISHGEVRPIYISDSYRPAAGAAIESSAVAFVSAYCSTPSWVCQNRSRPALSDLKSLRETSAAGEPRQGTAFSNTVVYPPVAHLAPAIAIWLSRIFGLGPIAWLYAGRLANSLLVIAATFLALRLVRGTHSDLLIFAVASLPSTLSLAATLSADAGVVSCSLLLVGVSMRLVAGRRASLRLWLALWIAVTYVGMAKVAYLPLALVPVVCAYCRGLTRSGAQALFAAGTVVVATAIWAVLTRPYVFPITTSPGVDVAGQIAFLWGHPPEAMRALLTSMILEVPHSQLTLVGWKLAGGDVLLPLPILAVSTLALVIGIVLSGSDETPTGVRISVLLLMLASACATFLLLYIQNTKVGGTRIEGYQGRYLLPILPFATLVLPTWRASSPRNIDRLRTFVIVCSCLSAAALTTFLGVRHWQ